MPDAPVRLTSLDAFRGFTIAAMVLVNNPGDWGNLHAQLAHAKWHGWTFTECIFPFFLFIGGVAMTLSLGRLAAAGADKPRLLVKLAKRAALIFLIGFLLNLVPRFDFEHVRIPGVLQRIALCTLLAAPIVVYLGWRAQLAVIALLLSLYAVLMLWVPVPGIGAGVLEPGQDFGAWVDRLLLDGHLWVQSKTWDPEGLVSTLPALCSQLLGVLAGRVLAAQLPRSEQTAWTLCAGLVFLALGSTLDALLMPINKSLWTVSYCLWMNGWALLAFGLFYWLLDANPHAAVRARAAAWARPFVIYGMNALFIFAFSGFVAKMLGFIKLAQPDGSQLSLGRVLYAPLKALPLGAANTSLLYAILFNACMFAIAYAMWRKRWFVKV
ncbi:heparan-alpha-glucosaminide N-acetyltransferase domain-containing protein [Massilia oculi]|uniref:Heparan-alpha-glucosaminide N-acetyltransferase domain-containing protein n=1 Tax=Massilia hydrophila TaxID=3044279 RepID=A0ABS7YE54_9BURK|nr:heparan-alpha-glucosaminide N-acetyltransferase domain-containing protein [Massilia oculi]MCA1857337.1 heparan-alpha-glucosaminide N-acetyltransferase domain-containing protein [Massilia oculi]